MDLHRKLLILLTSVLCLLTSVFGQTGSIFVDENHNGHKIFGLPTPVADDEAATKGYADSIVGGGGGVWGSITGTLSAQTDLQTALDNKQPIDADLTAIAALSGTNTIYYRSASNTWSAVTIGGNMTFSAGTLDAVAGGTGDVVGPASATDEAITRFDGTTGKLIQNSNVTISDAGAFTFPAGVRQTFDPSGTTPGINVGAISGDPNTPSNGDLWYDSMANELTARINGANVALGGGDVTAVANLTTGQLVVGSAPSSINVGNLSGDVTTSGGTATTIANDAVTYAKMQDVSAASKLLGRGDSGSGNAEEITLGTNLSMSGTTLNATGGGGGITNIATTSPITGGPITTTGTIALDVAVDHAFTTSQTMTLSDAATNTISNGLTVGHNSSGTPLADYGTGILLKGKSSSTNDRIMGAIQAGWATPTDGSRASYIELEAATATLAGSGLRVYSSGFVTNDASPDAGAAYINANTGFRQGGTAPTIGKILQSDASSFVASPMTYPRTTTAAGYILRDDGTNINAYPTQQRNASITTQTGFASDTYIVGSNPGVIAGDFKAKGQYRCVFDMVKTNQGTSGIVISVRIGTNGSTADTARLTFTFGAGTTAVDTGIFEVWVVWRTVGSGTSAVVQGICHAGHNLATTGLFNNASQWTIIGTPSGGFDSTTATQIGLSFNGGTNFAGTCTMVNAMLEQ